MQFRLRGAVWQFVWLRSRQGAADGKQAERIDRPAGSACACAECLALPQPPCSPGTDLSWYKNIPVPTSYMACNSGAWTAEMSSLAIGSAELFEQPGQRCTWHLAHGPRGGGCLL